MLQPSAPAHAAPPPVPTAPRVVVMTDFPPLDVIPVKACGPASPRERCSDPDDIQSMVRLLLYGNELDIEGLVASAATLANVARKRPLLELLDRYAQVQPALAQHDPRYPAAATLKLRTWQGLDGAWGTPKFGTPARPLEQLLGPELDTEASDALIRIVDRPDPRPVWVLGWGGSREIAQALWRVRQTRSADALARFVAKLRLYLVARQDGTTDWLLAEFPSLFIILSERHYMAMFSQSGPDPRLTDLDWLDRHVRRGHGPMAAAYPASGWDPAATGQQEGDSPSFLHLVGALRGVNDAERPGQPGWGGQFQQPDPSRNHWFDHRQGDKAILRAKAQMQAEFAERTSWMRDVP
ncbi:DUF1593 domain-containing protein [Roseateles sp. DC23W]|uniref:DUF1593 domain-containing protein n=1 Tax=Pelomonas dachongensis TaxID=3299029 RepID=A0ABW7ERU4_9BURK